MRKKGRPWQILKHTQHEYSIEKESDVLSRSRLSEWIIHQVQFCNGFTMWRLALKWSSKMNKMHITYGLCCEIGVMVIQNKKFNSLGAWAEKRMMELDILWTVYWSWAFSAMEFYYLWARLWINGDWNAQFDPQATLLGDCEAQSLVR